MPTSKNAMKSMFGMDAADFQADAGFATFDFSGLSERARKMVNQAKVVKGRDGSVTVTVNGKTIGPFKNLQAAHDMTKRAVMEFTKYDKVRAALKKDSADIQTDAAVSAKSLKDQMKAIVAKQLPEVKNVGMNLPEHTAARRAITDQALNYVRKAKAEYDAALKLMDELNVIQAPLRKYGVLGAPIKMK